MSEHERARITKLTDELFAKITELLPDEATDIRFDQFALFAIVSFNDEDGDDCEMPISRFETARIHVQHGIVSAVFDSLRSRLLS